MSDLKVRRGQPVTADSWNKVVDRLPANHAGQSAGGFTMSRVEILATNDSGSDRDIGEVLVIDTTDSPTTIYEAVGNIAPSLIDPVWHTKIAKLVILAEPIPDGETGLVVLSGSCLVKMSSVGEDDIFAMIDPDSVNELKGSTSGVARIAARISSTLALVNLRDEQPLWRYELTQDAQSGVTTATLLDLDSGLFATTFNLSDVPAWQLDEDTGFCNLCGNKFYAQDVGGKLWRYALTEDSQAPAATTATLKTLDTATDAGAISLRDPELIVDDQETGDTGYCIEQGGRYYAIQAVCKE